MQFLTVSYLLLVLVAGDPEIKKQCFQKYQGQIDQEQIVVNKKKIDVASVESTIELNKATIKFVSDGLSLKGNYKIVEEHKKNFFLSAELSDKRSLNIKMYFKLSKKGDQIIVTGSNFRKEKGVFYPQD